MELQTQWFLKAKSAEALAKRMIDFNVKMREDYLFYNLGKQGNEWYAWFTVRGKILGKALRNIEELDNVSKEKKTNTKDSK